MKITMLETVEKSVRLDKKARKELGKRAIVLNLRKGEEYDPLDAIAQELIDLGYAKEA